MGSKEESNNTHIENLAKRLDTLQLQVEELTKRLETVEADNRASALLQRQSRSAGARQPSAATPQLHSGPPPLFDTSALLPRISTICFLLVIALILRTITDNQIIDVQAGSILGMAYAGILILIGWRLYARNSRLAPIFPGCGILLLFSIILETHSHFGSLTTNAAYALLFVAAATVYTMSVRFRASKLICLAVPGAAAVALALDFPYPNFAVLSLLLLAAVIAASYAFKQLLCRYLRWAILVISALFWLLWTSKINTLPNSTEQVAAVLDPGWFFPMLFIFWGAYLVTVILNVVNKEVQLGFFESIIPTIAGAGAFGAGYVAISSWFSAEYLFYITITVIATLHLGLAWWLSRRDPAKAAGANVFILAGATLIVLASSTFFEERIGYILPIWSGSALVLAMLSAYLHNEGIRVTSYLLQITACATAILSGAVLVPAHFPLAAGLASISICIFGLVQYQWSRRHEPVPTNSFYFSKLDKQNYSAVALLVVGLIGGYYFAQFALYQTLSVIADDFLFQFKSGQSLIINIGAMILMYIALKNHSKEIIIVGSVVALIGAGKVFIFDLFKISGVPLVLSVFSTGVVAAFGSVVMGRWQKKEPVNA